MDDNLINDILNDLNNRKGPASEQTAQDILAALDGTGKGVAAGFTAAGKGAKDVRKSFLDLGQETEKTKKSTHKTDNDFICLFSLVVHWTDIKQFHNSFTLM